MFKFTRGSTTAKTNAADKNPERVYSARAVSPVVLEGLEDRRLMAFNVLAEYPTGASPVDVVLSDLNADNRPDMIVANSGSASVDVRLGNGAGTFGAATSLSLGGSPSSVAVGDFDGDGILDLAINNEGQESAILVGASGRK